MQTNNKLREALSDACYAMFNFLKAQNGGYEEMTNAFYKAKAALAEPVRNYEVGTPKEQAHRFHAFCMAHQSPIKGMCDPTCPCHEQPDKCHCMTAWAQMPYKEGGEK